MLYAGWELLNWVTLYLLVRAVFRAFGLLNRAWGALKTGTFCIVLFSICHGQSEARVASPAATVAATGNASSVSLGPHFVTIDANPMSSVVLTVAKGSINNLTGLQVTKSVAGTFLGGHRWENAGAGNYRIEKDCFSYNTTELLHWQLLGLTVYTQVKTLQGTAILR